MKCITLWQPKSLSYVLGVVDGDGFITGRAVGLRVKDRDFIETFAAHVRGMTGSKAKIFPCFRDGRRYWEFRPGSVALVDVLRNREFDVIPGPYCRGFFDSEGNAQIGKVKKEGWDGSWDRRIACYSNDVGLLSYVAGRLALLEIETKRPRPMKITKGKKGKNPTFEMKIKTSKESFMQFRSQVGFSIARKMKNLNRIIETYHPLSMSERSREMQRKGAASKRRRRSEVVLPRVLSEIVLLRDSGQKLTIRNCSRIIQGYGGLLSVYRHRELLQMALEV